MKRYDDPSGDLDPVVHAYMQDVDRSLLRRNLQLTPEERVRKLQDFVRLITRLRDAGRTARG
ncbi:MAG: hypothetical protein H0X67_02085 [Acidobacteria bacterium]|nr:hypothetical protein [Acidobacteriota bacterium]